MLRTVFAHLRAQWMGALALFLVIAGGTAYAADTIGSSDIIDGQVKTADIGNNQVYSADVRDDTLLNGGLTGADIKDQSGVDTCVLTIRLGQLCVRAENSHRTWTEALNHCANLDLRLPSLAEARELATTHDIPNVDGDESFWIDQWDTRGSDGVGIAYIVWDDVPDTGLPGSAPRSDPHETVCVTTPTN
jgi:hypothetical protein